MFGTNELLAEEPSEPPSLGAGRLQKVQNSSLVWELPFPICLAVAVAKTLDEARALIAEAIEFHIEGMRLHGEHVPEPTTLAELVDVR